MKTFRLNKNTNNALVLAKDTKYGIDAITWVNRTQVNRAFDKLDPETKAKCKIFYNGGRCFYIQVIE